MAGRQRKKHGSWLKTHKLSIVAFALVVVVLSLLFATLDSGLINLDQGSMKACIVDQLDSSYPNKTFWFTANSMFHENGWQLYYYAGGPLSDNVDFYRTLPQKGFRLIILRTHTAPNPNTGALAIFTSEKWDDEKAQTKYLMDFDLLDPSDSKLAMVAVTENSTKYFGITANFVKAMKGDFDGATVIMMGCEGLNDSRMAQAFTMKGARVYIGWTGLVSVEHTDSATQELLNYLVSEKRTVAEAVASTLTDTGVDPDYGSTLSYYPLNAGENKL